MIKKSINRNHNIINRKKDLIKLYSFKNFPIYQNCTDQDPVNDIFFDMNWLISKSTGIIQLNPLIPIKTLYKDQHASSIGKTWSDHHISFAKFIKKYLKKSVYEIGGSHGFLPKIILKNNKINWTIVEPNPLIKNKKIKIIKSFYTSKTKIPKKIDIVIHSHVLEHLFDPLKFLKDINKKINETTFHCFSIPNLKFWLENKFTNSLDFEHTLYLSEEIIDRILFQSGFEIIEKKFYKNHSIFYSTKQTNQNNYKYFHNTYDLNKQVYLDFIKFHISLIVKLNKKINNHEGDIYLFGAHIFSQFLISFGINTSRIKGIIDNDDSKHKKRLYGTNLNVYLPKILKNKQNISIILRAGAYNKEVSLQLKQINKSINIWN